jgi:hypothetical protein
MSSHYWRLEALGQRPRDKAPRGCPNKSINGMAAVTADGRVDLLGFGTAGGSQSSNRTMQIIGVDGKSRLSTEHASRPNRGVDDRAAKDLVRRHIAMLPGSLTIDAQPAVRQRRQEDARACPRRAASTTRPGPPGHT